MVERIGVRKNFDFFEILLIPSKRNPADFEIFWMQEVILKSMAQPAIFYLYFASRFGRPYERPTLGSKKYSASKQEIQSQK